MNYNNRPPYYPGYDSPYYVSGGVSLRAAPAAFGVWSDSPPGKWSAVEDSDPLDEEVERQKRLLDFLGLFL